MLFRSDLKNYDTNLKVNPPLRTKEDILALREGIKNGVIDFIASHHQPQHWDDKTCEFEYAKNGMIGLETLFGVMNTVFGNTTLLVEKLSVAPRKIFGLPVPAIKEGEAACLTLFDPAVTIVFEESMIRSRSHNSAFIGATLKGKVIGIINKNKTVINNK